MTVPRSTDPLVVETLALVEALGGGAIAWDEQPPFDAAGWAEWYALVEVHGLAPGLSRLLDRPRWSGLPAELQVRTRQEYLAQTARSLAAFRQFHEIHAAFAEAGIPVIPLKGLAFSRTLYTDAHVRQFGDLDLLVPEPDGLRAVELLKARGYTSVAAFTSPEEELLHARQAHFCPLVRSGALPVEVHTQVLKDRGDARLAREQVWAAAVPDEHSVLQLDPTHATGLAAAHYATHLRLGVGHLKWMVDLLLLLREGGSAHATALGATARQWDLLETIAPVLAAVGELAELRPTGVFAGSPVSAEALVYSPRDAGSRLLASAGSRLARLGELPGTAARVRYLLRLLFPTSEHLRYRYGISPEDSVRAYRVTHPFRLAVRLLAGVCSNRRSVASLRFRRPQPRHAR